MKKSSCPGIEVPSALERFLREIGPLSLDDHAVRERIIAQHSPQFRALSFFHSGEVVSTEILAYLLTPSAPHGQNDKFLKLFLKALKIDLQGQNLRSVSVQVNAPCYTQSTRKFIDILILFTAGKDNTALALESKSHHAGDRQDQVKDYLEHLRTAYSDNTRKFLFYLNDGCPPSELSIPEQEWNTAQKAGICHARHFQKVMRPWLIDCYANCNSRKLKYFLKDFAEFLKLERGLPVPIQSKTGKRIDEIIRARDLESGSAGAEFEAVLELYELHDAIWESAIQICLVAVRDLLKEQMPGWENKEVDFFRAGSSCVELHIWKSGWAKNQTPDLYVVLASEDGLAKHKDGCRGPTGFDLYILKRPGFSPASKVGIINERFLQLSPKKTDRAERVTIGIEDIRSAHGIRRLLDKQAAMNIATAIINFVQKHEMTMDSCFQTK